MILPSSTTTPAKETSISENSDPAANPTERCDDCRSDNPWIIHTVRLRGILRFFCTHCLLRNYPTSFCPSCFVFYDSSPPHASRRVSCSNCLSLTHTQCAKDAKSSSFLCPPCQNPSSFSFFRPITGTNGGRFIDKSHSKAFLCAAKIAASSMTKAVSAANSDVERRGREVALGRKRAREALQYVVMLDGQVKASSVIPKLKEVSIEKSANGGKKAKLSHASNGAVKKTESFATTTNSGRLKNNGGTEKHALPVQMRNVKRESDSFR